MCLFHTVPFKPRVCWNYPIIIYAIQSSTSSSGKVSMFIRRRETEKKKPECRQEKTELTNGVSAPPTILMLSWSSSPLWISIVDTSPSDTGFFPATMTVIIINTLLMLPSLDFYRWHLPFWHWLLPCNNDSNNKCISNAPNPSMTIHV